MAVDANTTGFIEAVAASGTGIVSIVSSTFQLFTVAPLNYIVAFGITMGALSKAKSLIKSRK